MGSRKDRPTFEQFEYHCEFRRLPGWPAYIVCSDGTLHSNTLYGKWRRLNCTKDKLGYYRITLSNDGETLSTTVHRLVMLAFRGPRPHGLEIRHLNGNPSDNRLVNLTYGTNRENHDDRVLHGTVPSGEQHYRSRLTNDDVNELRWLAGLGVKSKILKIGYEVSDSLLSAILTGVRWKHLPVIPYPRKMQKYSKCTVSMVRDAFLGGKSRRELSREFGIPYPTVSVMTKGLTGADRICCGIPNITHVKPKQGE